MMDGQQPKVDVLALVDRMIEAGEKNQVYTIAVSAASVAVDGADEKRFLIGDLAARLTKAHKTDVTGRFAKDIGEAVGRVREYKTVCSFWTDADRKRFMDLDLKYSHFRATAKKELTGYRDVAAGLLLQAGQNHWTAEMLGIRGKKEVRRIKHGDGQILVMQRILKADGCIADIQSTGEGRARLVIDIMDDVTAEAIECQKLGKPVQISIMAEYPQESED